MRPEAVAFVTGGSRGIGRAIVEQFAKAGMHVVIAARNEAQARDVMQTIAAAGGRSLAVSCDVTSTSSVTVAFDRAVEHFGRLDVLVNNAGIGTSSPLATLEEADWERTLAVNLTGVYRCTRVALPPMVERGYGRVINIASIAGQVGQPYVSAYCASKHGVIGFTRAIALEVAAKGVTVNAICPGYVETDLASAAIANIVQRTGRTAEQARAVLESMSPQRRLFTAREVAALALFLASDEAAGINGQAINIDGGQVQG